MGKDHHGQPKFYMRFLLTLSLLLAAATAEADLIKSDFQAPGDGYLATDTATSPQWLSQFATRNQAYGNATIQYIENTYGFHYATYDQTAAMLTSNFGSLDGWLSRGRSRFCGREQFHECFQCGRKHELQRRQRDCSVPTDPGTDVGCGWVRGPDNYADDQMGSWLVRDASAEPASVGLVLVGSGMLFIFRHKRARYGRVSATSSAG
ncbi:MAG: hypothetical protein EBY17_26410 [Acidobacteriia bacterium]|nr:hypothetical protein [Terriglobia bacterium]